MKKKRNDKKDLEPPLFFGKDVDKDIFSEFPVLPSSENDLEVQSEDYDKINSEYNIFIQKLEGIFREKEKTLKSLEKENLLNQGLIDEKNQLIKKLGDEINFLKNNAKIILDENSRLNNIQIQLKSQIQSLKNTLLKKEKEADQIKEEDLSLIQNNETLLMEIEKLKQEFEKYKKNSELNINELSLNLEQVSIQLKEEKIGSKEVKDNNKDLLSKNEQLSEEISAIKNELEKTDTVLKQNIKEHKAEIEKKEQEIINLKNQIVEKDSYYPLFMELQRQDYEEQIKNLVLDNNKKIQELKKDISSKMNLEYASQINKIKKETEAKEKQDIDRIKKEFSEKIKKENIVEVPKILPKISKELEFSAPEPNKKYSTEKKEIQTKPNIQAKVVPDQNQNKVLNAKKCYDSKTNEPINEDIIRILPMIDIAIQNGSKIHEIRKSLINSGFKEDSVEKALIYFQK